MLTILIISYLRAKLSSSVAVRNPFWQQIGKTTGGLIVDFIVMALTDWIGVVRIVCGQVLTLKGREYFSVVSGRGAKSPRILTSHLLPNVLAPFNAAAAFSISSAIMLESSLSYVGLGIQPPIPSWGA